MDTKETAIRLLYDFAEGASGKDYRDITSLKPRCKALAKALAQGKEMSAEIIDSLITIAMSMYYAGRKTHDALHELVASEASGSDAFREIAEKQLIAEKDGGNRLLFLETALWRADEIKLGLMKPEGSHALMHMMEERALPLRERVKNNAQPTGAKMPRQPLAR